MDLRLHLIRLFMNKILNIFLNQMTSKYINVKGEYK